MAIVGITIGSLVGFHLYDDTAFPKSAEFPGPVEVGTAPTDPTDVLRLVDIGVLVGDVMGPAASTNLAIAIFDGVTGKKIKNSLVTIGATGNIIVANGANIGRTGGPTLTFDSTNGYFEFMLGDVGIGTTVPEHPLHVIGNIKIYNGAFQSVRDDISAINRLETFNNNITNYSGFLFRRGLGAEASILPITTGTRISKLRSAGYYDSSSVRTAGEIITYATEDWSVTNNGLAFEFKGTPTGSATIGTWMTLIDGNVGFGITTPTAMADINSDIIRLRTAKTPATAAAAGNVGDICWDASFIYVCVAANTWKKIGIATW